MLISIYPETLRDDKRAIYKLTKAESTSVKDLQEGEVIEPDAYALFNDENSKGETNEVLCVRDKNGNTFSTISPTFKRDFLEVAELMEDDDYSVVVKKGKSKAGREFVTCELI